MGGFKRTGPLVGVILFLFLGTAHAQFIERSLVSSSGNQVASGALKLEWSVGESFTGNFATNDFRLTQGFHQGTGLINKLHDSPDWQTNIVISPNPVSNRLYFLKKGTDNFEIEILDVTGQQLGSKEWNSTNTSIDVSWMNNGIYLVLIKDDTGNHAFYKFIKQF
jgi:hypothetical protein